MNESTKDVMNSVSCWLIENVGYRCDGFEPTCFICQKWTQFDALFLGMEDSKEHCECHERDSWYTCDLRLL